MSNRDASESSPFDQTLEAWRLAGDATLGAPATDETITAADAAFGHPLPAELVALARLADGADVVGGNLSIEPLSAGPNGGVTGFGRMLREHGWPIPPEVIPFGGNGAGDIFGLWHPLGEDPELPTPVVMIGAVFEPACLALVGTSLAAFLRSWSGYYLVLTEAPTQALDTLDVPAELRARPEDLDELGPFFEWADPALPDFAPDPYAKGRTAAAVAQMLRDQAGGAWPAVQGPHLPEPLPIDGSAGFEPEPPDPAEVAALLEELGAEPGADGIGALRTIVRDDPELALPADPASAVAADLMFEMAQTHGDRFFAYAEAAALRDLALADAAAGESAALHGLVRTDPEGAWPAILTFVKANPDSPAAGGLIENLIYTHDMRFVDRIEAAAFADPLVRAAVEGCYVGGMATDGVVAFARMQERLRQSGPPG